MYVVLEMVDDIPQTPAVLVTRRAADALFEKLIADQAPTPIQEFMGPDLAHESAGTLRAAGDEFWWVQMWEV